MAVINTGSSLIFADGLVGLSDGLVDLGRVRTDVIVTSKWKSSDDPTITGGGLVVITEQNINCEDDTFEENTTSVDLSLSCCLDASNCDIGQYCCNGVCQALPCDTCSLIDFCGQCDENGDSQDSMYGIVATWNVTIPNQYTLPLEIAMSGGVNDLLLINGGGPLPFGPYNGVTGYFAGWHFNKTYVATERSFTMSLFNTAPGSNATFTVCPLLDISLQ